MVMNELIGDVVFFVVDVAIGTSGRLSGHAAIRGLPRGNYNNVR